MSNQCAAVAAVRRSTLPGGRVEASSAPGRSSAVDMAKWIGVAGTTSSSAVPVPVVKCLARAASIIATDGSTPKARVKCGANERVAVPGPQPTSRRVVSWQPVERGSVGSGGVGEPGAGGEGGEVAMDGSGAFVGGSIDVEEVVEIKG